MSLVVKQTCLLSLSLSLYKQRNIGWFEHFACFAGLKNKDKDFIFH